MFRVVPHARSTRLPMEGMYNTSFMHQTNAMLRSHGGEALEAPRVPVALRYEHLMG